MKQYLDIVRNVLTNGREKESRHGGKTLSLTGIMIKHNWSQGFPLLTTKYIPFPLIASELEFFIRGKTNKEWLQERNNHIWDEWCNPQKVPYGHSQETKKKMEKEKDLGPIYGYQWRHFNAPYKGPNKDYEGEGVDQLKKVVRLIKEKPYSRRILVSAWNPEQQGKMALPPCHIEFQILVNNDTLDLIWRQRSVDVMLGLPFNIASYALLQHLLCKETGYNPGSLTGFLGDTHIYTDHVEGARKQIQRTPLALPSIKTKQFTSLFEWEYIDTTIIGYEHHPHISFDIAV